MPQAINPHLALKTIIRFIKLQGGDGIGNQRSEPNMVKQKLATLQFDVTSDKCTCGPSLTTIRDIKKL